MTTRQGRCHVYPMNPVFAVDVSDAAVEGVGRQYEDEVSSVADAAQKIVVEFAGTKLLNVEEHGETTQLQVNFQQTAHTHAANDNPARGRTDHFSIKTVDKRPTIKYTSCRRVHP